VRRYYAEGGITPAHCRQSKKFSNDPRVLEERWRMYRSVQEMREHRITIQYRLCYEL
jgi:hypothetical protein